MKKKLTISTDVEITDNYFDEITLQGDGCLRIILDSDFRELTIGTLINNKKYSTDNECDIYITSKDGESAKIGSGKDGNPGMNGGEFVINVNNLTNNVNVYIVGANGGNGGSGSFSNVAVGRDGGNGGNGGNGANVTFNYKTKENPQAQPILCKNEGGEGGEGGVAPVGKGQKYGIPADECIYGAKNGNGGKAGLKGSFNFINKSANTLKKSLNLNNNDEYKLFLKHFEGEKTLKKYPLIWKAIQRKRKKTVSNGNTQSYTEFDDLGSKFTLTPNTQKKLSNSAQSTQKGMSNDVSVDSYNLEINTTLSVINCKASDSAEVKAAAELPICCIQKILVRDINSDETVFKRIRTIGIDEHPYQINTYINKAIEATRVLNKNIIGEVSYTFYYSKRQNVDVSLESYPIQKQDTESTFYKQTILSEPHYFDTAKKDGDLKFLYGREKTQNDLYKDADYFGNREDGLYLSNGQQKQDGQIFIPTTIIPLKGKIFFESNPYFKLDRIEPLPFDKSYDGTLAFSPRLTYANQAANFIVDMADNYKDDENKRKELLDGIITHFKVNFNGDENAATMEFDVYLRENGYTPPQNQKYFGKYDWESSITDAKFINENYVYNYCYLKANIPIRLYYKLKNIETNEPATDYIDYVIQIRSDEKLMDSEKYFESTLYGDYVKIPRIMIAWGCFAADTMIKTIDCTKKVCEIKMGDKLPVYGGKILTVSSIYVGEDKWIYNIKTTDEKSIKVSGGHAMKLYCEDKPNGKKIPAGKIKKGDILMTPNGNVEVESVDEETYNDKVYNFEFEEEKTPNYVEANGFWSGDFNAQNETEKIELSPDDQAIYEEMKQLAAELSKKAQQ